MSDFLNIDQMTCTGAYLIPRGVGTYDAILKYVLPMVEK